MRKLRYFSALFVLLLYFPVFSLEARKPTILYIATDGDDNFSGRFAARDSDGRDGPFATLEKAREEARKLSTAADRSEGITVLLRGGSYFLEQPLRLTRDDSGSADARMTYGAYGGERVILTGGRRVEGFERVTDAAALARLDVSARGKIVRAYLGKSGVADLGSVTAANRRIELFFDDLPMTLSRWPDEDFARVVSVTGGKPFKSHGIAGDHAGKFTYDGDRPSRWIGESDLRLHGYWFWDWSDAYQKVSGIDVEKREISLHAPWHHYGYRPGQRYYALNALIELDRPGEWYLDRESGVLYFWPPGPIEAGRPTVSVLENLIVLDGASHVTIRGLTLEVTRSTPVIIRGGQGNRIEGCTIRNTGGWAVALSGRDSAVIGCDIYRTAEGGISMSGGNREKLEPSHLVVENNHIHDFGRLYRTYRPAVGVAGVGCRVAHNLIHNGPHNAIQLGGNDHLIEFNEVYDVCYETGDVGAFYMGRDWTQRGTVIRHNFFHHLQGPGLHGAMAVYLDDAASGIDILGNVFYRAGRAAFIGGGRDNRVEGNIFVECKPSVHVDARALGWMRDTVTEGGVMRKRLAAMPYKTPPWSERYPKLVNILDGDPGIPSGNLVARNLSVGGRWADIEAKARPLLRLEDNLRDVDPGFVDAEAMNFQLRDDSPALARGFRRIPFEKIGLYADERRASWPVKKILR